MERTAVDWLFTTLDNILELYPSEWSKVSKAVEEAKLKEKENLEDCWIAAHQAGRFEGKGIAEEDWQTFFNYYNETYNK
jgi:hypothetical protein